MSAAFADTWMTWDDLLETWRNLDVPEGWRPELTPEGIRMAPPPVGGHNLIADRVHRALLGNVPDELGVFQTQGIGIPDIGYLCIPDLCVVPRSAVSENSDPAPGEDVLLVVEITSKSNAHHDRKKKKWAYAHGPIPQFLLIDRFDGDGPSVTLFSDPADGAYRKSMRVAFGQPIEVGPPFDVELDTSGF